VASYLPATATTAPSEPPVPAFAQDRFLPQISSVRVRRKHAGQTPPIIAKHSVSFFGSHARSSGILHALREVHDVSADYAVTCDCGKKPSGKTTFYYGKRIPDPTAALRWQCTGVHDANTTEAAKRQKQGAPLPGFLSPYLKNMLFQ
jgi:hypothetical protein